MKVLLLGSNGMLGQAVRKVYRHDEGVQLYCAARTNADFNLDLTDDARLRDCFVGVKPDVVINAAAIVNLQRCEQCVEDAYRTNARLCSVLSELSREHGSYFVHVSTDHYYCAETGGPSSIMRMTK